MHVVPRQAKGPAPSDGQLAGPEIVLRCDSGLWSRTVIEFCEHHRWEYSITVRQIPTIGARIDLIAPDGDGCRWLPMPDYPATGHCEITETDYDDDNPARRLIDRACRNAPVVLAEFPHLCEAGYAARSWSGVTGCSGRFREVCHSGK